MRTIALAALALGLAAVPSALSSHGGSRDQSPSWSPDGKRIAFVTRPGRVGEIWVANVDGTGHRKLSRGSDADVNVAWSPDGTELAFSSSRSGEWDIYVMAADGSRPRRITTSPAPDWAPAWSPDGSRIAFYRRNEARNRNEIWLVGAEGSGERRLATAGDNGEPAWSPDGARIAFQSHRDGNWEIYVMRADGTGQRRVTRTPGRHEGEPSWSPDGRIVFSAGAGENRRDIYSIAANGSGERRLTRLARGLWAPRISGDGKRLAFFEFPPGAIWIANADGSGTTRLFDRISVQGLTISTRRPAAGKPFALSLRVAGAGAGTRTSCEALVAGFPLTPAAQSFRAGEGRCAWRLPANSARKRLRATIVVEAENGRVLRSFAAVIR